MTLWNWILDVVKIIRIILGELDYLLHVAAAEVSATRVWAVKDENVQALVAADDDNYGCHMTIDHDS